MIQRIKISQADLILCMRAVLFRMERLHDLGEDRSDEQNKEFIELMDTKKIIQDSLGHVTIIHPDITDAKRRKR